MDIESTVDTPTVRLDAPVSHAADAGLFHARNPQHYDGTPSNVAGQLT